MHMSHAAAVQAYLADKNPTWSDNLATWNEDGHERRLAYVDGPLTADAIIDAHVRALASRATLTIAHAGTPTPIALRTAARFGITLLDATTLPHPAAPLLLPPHEPAFELPPPGFFRALERAPAEASGAAEAFAAMDAPAVASTGEAPPVPPVVAPVATSTGVPTPVEIPPAPVPTPVVADVVVAASSPDPVLAHADPALPWDLSLSAPEPEPVHVEPVELAAMPWNLHAEQHELLPAGRDARFTPVRPTQMAQEWGLPWPRPVVPTGGIAIADPKIWHAQERIEQVREDLNKVGAPSFGAVKPEGSAWLKRITEFG